VTYPATSYRHPSPEEVVGILTRLGLTHVAAARLLCMDERTIRRYVRGDTIMHYPILHCLIHRQDGISVLPDSWREDWKRNH